MSGLRAWARRLKSETLALYFAVRHPLTPWYARLWAGLVVGYALSPIDLIPDFVPVLGYLDDVILIPGGIALAIRLIPPAVLAECRAEAQARIAGGRPRSWAGAAAILILWLALVTWLGWKLLAWRGSRLP